MVRERQRPNPQQRILKNPGGHDVFWDADDRSAGSNRLMGHCVRQSNGSYKVFVPVEGGFIFYANAEDHMAADDILRRHYSQTGFGHVKKVRTRSRPTVRHRKRPGS